jgi:ankyrin repeat protein
MFHHFDAIDGELEYGSDDVLRYLLAQWPSWVYERDINGNTIFHHAVRSMARLEAVELLVRLWPGSLRVRNNQESLPVHCALDQEDPSQEILEFLVRSWRDLASESDNQGRRPICVTLDTNEPAVKAVRFLARQGLGPAGQQNAQGQLPLHITAERDHSLENVHLLVETCPLPVLVEDAHGRNPLELAGAANNSTYTLELLYYLTASRAEMGLL